MAISYSTTEERDQLLTEMSATMTSAEVAKAFDVRVDSIYRWCRKLDIKCVTPVLGIAAREEELRGLLAEKLSAIEIAEKMGYHETSVRNLVRKLDLKFYRNTVGEQHDIIVALAEAGKTIPEIAEELGIKPQSLKVYISNNKISVAGFKENNIYRTVEGVTRKKLTHRLDELRQWADEGLYTDEIAELTGFGKNHVWRTAKENGIKLKLRERKNPRTDHLITREGWYKRPVWEPVEIDEVSKDMLFADYYRWWVFTFKVGTIRDVSINKYRAAHGNLTRFLGDIKLGELTRVAYQNMITAYGEVYHIQTVRDFHNILKASINDAVYDGHLEKNPTYNVAITGQTHGRRKAKFISEHELKDLLSGLDYGNDFSNRDVVYSWFIYLSAKTGARFGEILGLTVRDFNFETNEISISKTWDYKLTDKDSQGFKPTKNKSSVRTISLDPQTMHLFRTLTKDMQTEKPIWLTHLPHILNTQVNDYLEVKCKQAKIKCISSHSLRHTHASILLAKGVTMISISKRLGHSNLATTQKVYSHITEELARKDDKLLRDALGGI